jgi:hypothetical protein
MKVNMCASPRNYATDCLVRSCWHINPNASSHILNRQKDEPVSSMALKRTLGLACFLLNRTNNIGYHSSASPLNAGYGGFTGSR